MKADWLVEAVERGAKEGVYLDMETADITKHIIASVRQAFLDQVVGPMAGLERAMWDLRLRQIGRTRSGTEAEVEGIVCREYVDVVRRWLRAQVEGR